MNVIERRDYFVALTVYLNVFVTWLLPIFVIALYVYYLQRSSYKGH